MDSINVSSSFRHDRTRKHWLIPTLCATLALCHSAAYTPSALALQDDVYANASLARRPRLDVTLLEQLESRVLPPVIIDGAARFHDLPDYYWAENPELQERLQLAQSQFENPRSESFRALTLIAGSAGIGKTFIKRGIFSGDDSKSAICKFDIKELYAEWREYDLVEDRPDLHCQDLVVCRLPALKNRHSDLLLDYLESQPASFFVIDSLDEVHPDDYEVLLDQIEQFVLKGDRPFLHVVVLGRPPAFRDYWKHNAETIADQPISLFMLNPPRLLTTGDLQVSSWNYHTWRYQLRWQSAEGEPEIMPFPTYVRWVEAGFPKTISGHSVSYAPNRNMHSEVHATLEDWAKHYPVVNSMLASLAGNGMVREIAEAFAHEQRTYDERQVMEAFLEKWLERDADCENRPSCSNSEHLELYMRLLESVAARYLREGKVDSDGYFHVDEDDRIEFVRDDLTLSFTVTGILDRSGLKYFDPRKAGDTAYRFEPVWLHRLLVHKYNESNSAE